MVRHTAPLRADTQRVGGSPAGPGEGRPEAGAGDLEIQVSGAAGRGGPDRSALKVRDDDGTGPLTSGSGRMGSKDPVGISGRISAVYVYAGARSGQQTLVGVKT